MNVIVAKTAGFCFGVQRAVDMVFREAEENKGKVYTYGPIIHNETVVADLEKKGVTMIPEGTEDLPSEGTVVIRSHGISRAEEERLRAAGLRVVDATCPFVKKIHRIAEEEGKKGRVFVVAGDPDHPEVQGIIGWASGPAYVIRSYEEFLALPDLGKKPVTLAAQTTFNYKKFIDLVAKVSSLGYDITCVNTICNATQDRQAEAKQIAGTVDGMYVIGSTQSSNTRKLYEICKAECNQTFHIQTAADIREEDLKSMDVIGITAGASTPKNIIEEVQTHVRSKF